MEAFEAFLAGSPSTMGELGDLEPLLPDAKPNRTPHRLDCDHSPSNGDDMEDVSYLTHCAFCPHIVEPLGDILGIRSNPRSTFIP